MDSETARIILEECSQQMTKKLQTKIPCLLWELHAHQYTYVKAIWKETEFAEAAFSIDEIDSPGKVIATIIRMFVAKFQHFNPELLPKFIDDVGKDVFNG